MPMLDCSQNFKVNTPPQATGHQTCNAESGRVFDPRGSRRLDIPAYLSDLLLGGINNELYDISGYKWIQFLHESEAAKISSKIARKKGAMRWKKKRQNTI